MDIQSVQRLSDTKSRFFYGYIVVIFSFMCMMVIFGTYNAFGVFFNPLLAEFGWSRAMTSGAFSLSSVMFGVFGIVMGWLNDRFGPRLVLSLSGFLLGLGYLLMSQLGAVWQLYLFFGVLIGSGVSGGWVPILSTVAKWFIGRRSLMGGIVLTGVSIGGFITPLAATFLINAYGWRKSYMVLASIVLVIVVLSAQFLRRDPAKVGQLPFGESRNAERSLSAGAEALSLTEAIRFKQFWFALAMLFCSVFVLFVITVHIVPHATELGFSAANAAAGILGTMSGLSIAGRVVLGSAADRIGNRRVFLIGFGLELAALLWLIQAGELWQLYLFAGVYGFAYGGLGMAESPLVAALFGLGSHGLIYGAITLGCMTGGAIGPFLAGYLFDVTGSYQPAFMICIFIAVVGLILAAILRPIKGMKSKI